MRLPWRRAAIAVESRQVSCTQTRELETAKEILAEVFHIRPAEVEQMLLRRLEERNGRQEHQVGPWPATFCLGE